MITKEKYIVLNGWISSYVPLVNESNAGITCLGSGIAGVIVAELNDNHKLFAMPLEEAIPALSALVDDYSAGIGDLMR